MAEQGAEGAEAKALAELLASLFDVDGLKRFLTLEGKAVVGKVSWKTGLDDAVFLETITQATAT